MKANGNKCFSPLWRPTGGPSCWPSWLCAHWWAAPSSYVAARWKPPTWSDSGADQLWRIRAAWRSDGRMDARQLAMNNEKDWLLRISQGHIERSHCLRRHGRKQMTRSVSVDVAMCLSVHCDGLPRMCCGKLGGLNAIKGHSTPLLTVQVPYYSNRALHMWTEHESWCPSKFPRILMEALDPLQCHSW